MMILNMSSLMMIKSIAASELRAIITAERLKQVRQTAKIEAIINTFDFTDN